MKNEAIQGLCREALTDAKSGDEDALAWLVREFDYYGKCAVLWATQEHINWRNPQLALSGGPVHGDHGGVGETESGGWRHTPRYHTPDHLVAEAYHKKIDKKLRELLSEDECYFVLGEP